MDLRNKAKWHIDLNSGSIPLLEFPDGDLIYESRIIMDCANNLGKDQGIFLWPHEVSGIFHSIPTMKATASHKLSMLKFDKMAANFWEAFKSKWEDSEIL